jgi:hypothetical protein
MSQLKHLRMKQAEIMSELRAVNELIRMLEIGASEVCVHPNLKVTPYEKDCPDCSYYVERSF